MHFWSAVWAIARWEFHRYVKWKQQLVGMLMTIAIFGGFTTIQRVGSSNDEPREVAVIGAQFLPLLQIADSSFRFTPRAAGAVASARKQVDDGELPALLILHSPDSAELIMRRRARWVNELRVLLTVARQQKGIADARIDPAVLGAIMTPPAIDVKYTQMRAGNSRGERVVVVIVIGLMLMTVFMGMSYVFVSVTGEKQIRVTEQVVSAIPAQAWIDGKMLGLIAVSLVGMAGQVVSFGIVYLIMRVIFNATPLSLPESLGDPGVVALVIIFAVIGLFFWFAFLGALAATIDDPNHSARGGLIFLPVFATAMAFFVLGDADSPASTFFSIFPATSPSSMPARLLTAHVGPGEIAVSLLVLTGATLLLRVAAGRIFRLGMLMYGKEPSWAEMRRWMFSK